MRETGATPHRHAARSRGHPGIFAPSCMTKRLDAARPDARLAGVEREEQEPGMLRRYRHRSRPQEVGSSGPTWRI